MKLPVAPFDIECERFYRIRLCDKWIHSRKCFVRSQWPLTAKIESVLPVSESERSCQIWLEHLCPGGMLFPGMGRMDVWKKLITLLIFTMYIFFSHSYRSKHTKKQTDQQLRDLKRAVVPWTSSLLCFNATCGGQRWHSFCWRKRSAHVTECI